MTKNNPAPPTQPHYMTPNGYATLEKELHWLLHDERPKITDIVSWAAGNGDRSENGDYIYNKKRLREIDRRVRYLTKKLENTVIVNPRDQQKLQRIFFGAKVTYAREDDSEVTVDLGKINWQSPVGNALMKAEVGDTVKVRTDTGLEKIEVVEISYPID